MAKTGRNDPCPCGSGKKYKRCCYEAESQRVREKKTHQKHAERSEETERAKAEAAFAGDPEWLRIRRTEGEMSYKIADFAIARYGKNLFKEATGGFNLFGRPEIEDIYVESIFMPWFVFTWVPPREDKRRARALPKQQLGIEYLDENATLLDEYQRSFIREACAQPFTFFVITAVEPGKSMALRDLFLDRTFTVKEAGASRTARPGEVVFARVVPLEDQAIIVGMGPIGIPPREHLTILDFRDDFTRHLREHGIELDVTVLGMADAQVREAYFSIVEKLNNPPRPRLENTDGDPLTLLKLHFELACSPREAADGLKSLALPRFQDVIVEHAVLDAEGNVLEVSFDWVKEGNKRHKHWDNTKLGGLTIKGNTLTAEVNSEKRAKKLKSEIKARLGKKAVFKRAERESLEDKLDEAANQPDGQPAEDGDTDELESRPEVQAMLKAELEAHWEGWYDNRLPALRNQTPIAAARTEAGRERLEALLSVFERRNETVLQPFLRVDVEAIRKRLKL